MSRQFFQFDKKITDAAGRALELCAPQLTYTEEIQEYHQQKMLYAFQKAGVSESHFVSSTGYGYGDRGRDALDEVFATVFEAEDALVRHNFVSGTHALAVALFGVLRPGDKMVCVTGTPYDTLLGVIGIGEEAGCNSGTLRDFSIEYSQLDLMADGTVDYGAMENIAPDTKMVYIQRSRGYSLRPSLHIGEIGQIARRARELAPDCIVMLDNCYGEFIEKEEPLANGVDLMAGSLIKNPGGGIAPTGGYIAGKKELVEQCACRLTTPSTGREIGATLGNNRELFMGAFSAPHVTGEAVKTAIFASALFEILGFEVSPALLRRARRHYTGIEAQNKRSAHGVLPRDTEGRACRFLRRARALGHARLRQQGNHGGGRVHARRLY